MREQPNHAVAPTPAPKMDWAPVRLVLKDSLSQIGLKGTTLFILVGIATAAIGFQVYLTERWHGPANLGGYYTGLTLLALLFLIAGFNIASRDKILWPILPMNREHRALLKWLRLLMLPWLAVMVFIPTSMAVVSALCYPESPFPNLTMTLIYSLSLVVIFQVIVVAYCILDWINRFADKYFVSRFASKAIIIVLSIFGYFVGLNLRKFMTLFGAASGIPILVGLFVGSIALLSVSYWMRMLMVDEHGHSIHPNADIVPAKMPNKPMPVNSIMGSFQTRFLVSIIGHALLPLFVLYMFAQGGIVTLLLLLPVSLFIFRQPITLLNARELRMLPMSRRYKAWISGWEALAQTALQLLVAIIACNAMRYYRGNFDDPWGGNALAIVLLTSGLALLVRPLFVLLVDMRDKNEPIVLYFILEYILAVVAIGAIYMASVPFKEIPMVPMINEYSRGFTIVSTIIFAAALVSAPHLMKIMWDRESFYRRGPQERQ